MDDSKPHPSAQQKRKKKALPPPGRKLSMQEARERANKRFAKALAKLAES